MLVWHDTLRRTMATPDWLPGDSAPVRCSRKHGERGDLLCVGDRHAALLGWREDVTWADAGDGWAVACYGDPCLDDLIRPEQRWTLVASVIDGRDRTWLIPALLGPTDDPTIPGPPLVAMARRLTASGWIREPLHDRQRDALDAVAAAFPHLCELGQVSLETQGSWIGALLHATYYGGALSFAASGLIDDVLVDKGLRIACGRVPDYLRTEVQV